MSVTLEAVRLTKTYGSSRAIEDVNFAAEAGEVMGLLGPNGAGKTTTIRLLTTVLQPTSGEFWVAGQPWTAATEIRRRVGVLLRAAAIPALRPAASICATTPASTALAAKVHAVWPRICSSKWVWLTVPIRNLELQPRHAPASGHCPRIGEQPCRRLSRRADPRARPCRSSPGPQPGTRHRSTRDDRRSQHTHLARGGAGVLTW